MIRQQSMKTKLDNQLKTTVEENGQKIIPMVKTIIFYGRYNIPLQGHRYGINFAN